MENLFNYYVTYAFSKNKDYLIFMIPSIKRLIKDINWHIKTVISYIFMNLKI